MSDTGTILYFLPVGTSFLAISSTVLYSLAAGTTIQDLASMLDNYYSPPLLEVLDMTETNRLLRELLNAVTTEGAVILDGQKVGTALSLGSYKTQ